MTMNDSGCVSAPYAEQGDGKGEAYCSLVLQEGAGI